MNKLIMDKMIEFYRSESILINDAIDRIVVELHIKKKQNGKNTILLTGCSAESGTTATAINLAVSLSKSGWKTLLVDCDLRKSSEYKRLNQQDENGLSDYLNGDIEKTEMFYNTNYENLKFIPGGKHVGNAVRLLCSAGMEALIGELKDEYDYVIFDFPSLNIVSDAEIICPYVDGIVLMAALNQTTKLQLQEAKRKAEKYEGKFYGIIVNKVDLPQYRRCIKDYDYFRLKNMSKKYEKHLEKKRKQKKGWNGDNFDNMDFISEEAENNEKK